MTLECIFDRVNSVFIVSTDDNPSLSNLMSVISLVDYILLLLTWFLLLCRIRFP